MVARHIDDSGDYLLSLYRFCCFDTSFDDQHGFVVFFPQTIDVRSCFLNRFLPRLSMFATDVPIRIDAEANHVVTSLILSQSIKDEVITVKVESSVEMAVQVAGKLKGTVVVPMDSDQDTVMAEAVKLEKVQRAMEGMDVVKVIFKTNKILNLILKPKA